VKQSCAGDISEKEKRKMANGDGGIKSDRTDYVEGENGLIRKMNAPREKDKEVKKSDTKSRRLRGGRGPSKETERENRRKKRKQR
jgi:hypothetical protein